MLTDELQLLLVAQHVFLKLEGCGTHSAADLAGVTSPTLWQRYPMAEILVVVHVMVALVLCFITADVASLVEVNFIAILVFGLGIHLSRSIKLHEK